MRLTPEGLFPPKPKNLRGRSGELAALVREISPRESRRFALVGQGGSGKSVLACALGHRVASMFRGHVHWFRVGAWDARTIGEMLAMRFGTTCERSRLFPALSRHMAERGPMFVVFDNHEDDRAMARVLDELRDAKATWIITARRCLLSGVSLYPVTPPLVAAGRNAFPRVAQLTKLLRFNPLGLDIADALVASGATSVVELRRWLIANGIQRVRAIDHEDDLPEVALLVDFAYRKLGKTARRLLLVLSQVTGDHVGIDSLLELARASGAEGRRALERLVEWHLVQEPFRSRYALHAVVKYALRNRGEIDAKIIVDHYLDLLERHPDRFDLEQTHFFAAMDYAHTQGNLPMALRIDELFDTLRSALSAEPL
ncbi:MAG TPA: ABC transporter ATP-binding protein [Polyangiaceae bacterium]